MHAVRAHSYIHAWTQASITQESIYGKAGQGLKVCQEATVAELLLPGLGAGAKAGAFPTRTMVLGAVTVTWARERPPAA